MPANVVVSKKRSLAVAGQYIERNVCVLNFASATNAGGVILGAFGCGAFQNSPDVVARAMNEIVEKYLYSFKIIEFAVYCPPENTKNYDVFKRTLS